MMSSIDLSTTTSPFSVAAFSRTNRSFSGSNDVNVFKTSISGPPGKELKD